MAMRRALTPFGWMVAGEAVVLLSSRWWPARYIPEPATLVLAVALLVLLMLAWWLAPRCIRGVEGRWFVEPRLPFGEEVAMGIDMQASSWLPPCTIEARHSAAPRQIERLTVRSLRAGAVRPMWSTRFMRRGVVKLSPLVVRCMQPFGVVEAWRVIGPGQEVVVLPAIGSLRQAMREQLSSWQSELSASTGSGSDDVDHLRAYRPGDAVHAIHWRATARHGSLLVAERQNPVCLRAAIVLDTSGQGVSGSLDQLSFEQMVAAAATLATACLQMGWQVSLHGGFAPLGMWGDTGEMQEMLALAGMDGVPLVHVTPDEPAVVILTGNPAAVPNLAQPPLVLPASQLADFFRLPARLR